MSPPTTLNVIDAHGGFTAVMRSGDTLWRPGDILKRGTVGNLVDACPKSFYQSNDDVTKATYKVPGYGYPVVTWWDNQTGTRIA